MDNEVPPHRVAVTTGQVLEALHVLGVGIVMDPITRPDGPEPGDLGGLLGALLAVIEHQLVPYRDPRVAAAVTAEYVDVSRQIDSGPGAVETQLAARAERTAMELAGLGPGPVTEAAAASQRAAAALLRFAALRRARAVPPDELEALGRDLLIDARSAAREAAAILETVRDL